MGFHGCFNVMFLVNPLFALSKSVHIRNDNHTFTLLFLRHRFVFFNGFIGHLLFDFIQGPLRVSACS